jgi:hypothetical protein
MAFPFMSTGEPERTATPAAKTQPRPPAQPQVTPRQVRPFSTTKLAPKSASATDLLKLAHLKSARTWGEFAFGNGMSSAFDPNNRGVATDMLAYSNPISGTVMGVNDTARHLYNGHYGSALGSLGMMGLSYLPGAGAAGALTRGGAAAAKGLGTAAAKSGLKAVAAPAASTAAKGFMGQAGAAVGKGLGGVGMALNAVHQPMVNAVAPGSRLSRAVNPLNHAAAFGRRSGLQSVDNAAMALRGPAQYGAQVMQNNKMLRYPAMAAGLMAHNHGLNPSGEGQSDVNARLSDGREDMLSQLPNLNY